MAGRKRGRPPEEEEPADQNVTSVEGTFRPLPRWQADFSELEAEMKQAESVILTAWSESPRALSLQNEKGNNK